MIRVESIALPRRRPSVFSKISRMSALARQRKALSRLDDHQLADIGVTAEMAAEEAARPAWDTPKHWRG